MAPLYVALSEGELVTPEFNRNNRFSEFVIKGLLQSPTLLNSLVLPSLPGPNHLSSPLLQLESKLPPLGKSVIFDFFPLSHDS